MRNFFAIFLAFLLVTTSIACVCVAQASESISDPHAHHGHSEMAGGEPSECPHQDCDGDCGNELVLTKDRDNSSKISFKIEGLDDLEFHSAASLYPDPQQANRSADPPYYAQNIATLTPVQRKDLLLE